MSTVDIIERANPGASKRFIVGEAHDSGTFGMRSEHDTIEESWNATKTYANRHKIRIGIVSSVLAAEIVRLGLAESFEEISK